MRKDDIDSKKFEKMEDKYWLKKIGNIDEKKDFIGVEKSEKLIKDILNIKE